jgi:hypothetical protein
MNKPILFLHAGLFKTGTSSIQNFLSLNYETLLKNSVLYPTTGRDELINHHYFFSSMRIPEHPYFKPRKKFTDYLVDFENEIALNNPKKVILSSEIFCDFNSQEPSVLEEKLEQLFSLFSKVKVIFYLRRPDHYGISMNNTSIWYGGRKIHTLTYPNMLSWTNVLEKEKLVFRPFEKEQFVEGDLYKDFLFTVDCEKFEGLVFPEKNLNESINDDILELLRIVNNAVPEVTQNNNFKYKLLAAFRNYHNAKNAFFSPQDRYDIISKYEEDNRIIAREFLGREDGILFYEPLPDTNEPWEPYKGLPVETVAHAFSYLLFKHQEHIDNLNDTNNKLRDEINDQKVRITEIEKQLNEIKKNF